MKVTKPTFITFTKEDISCRYYTTFISHIQPVKIFLHTKMPPKSFRSPGASSHLLSLNGYVSFFRNFLCFFLRLLTEYSLNLGNEGKAADQQADQDQNYEYGYSVSDRQQFVGEFTGERKGDLAAVAVKNKFSVGDSLELMTPQGNINFTLEHMENAKGEAMPVAPGDGYTVWLPVPQDLELNYALLMRNFSGETTRNPHGK